ncbi:hypothetical protein [Paenibacillus thermotolerans]|uniref:hypothetical protein n=1 Tax=Paenibacillus thermotolerans TaxID=3027807 RepID=UPI0023682C04|nr:MULTISPECIES: hypothetical protein [unclassified Paenibacillus]
MNVDFCRSVGALMLLAEIGCFSASAPAPASPAKHDILAAGNSRNRMRRATFRLDELPDAC